MKLTKFIKSILMSAFIICYAGILYSQQLAFPTAEGFGKYTVGGRGGQVYEVTNLNDSGAGSLRDAINKSGPRTIVFRVSGTIELKSNLSISRPYITIAGQTAPGDGICLRNYPIVIGTDEVIIRYIRVRLGDQGATDADAVSSRFNKNIIIDHVSASWSIDECISLYHNDSITVQWCLISESLYLSNPSKGHHGFGGIWGGPNASFHHNLLAHHSSRNPRFSGGCGNTDHRNNVLYNWGYQSAYGGEAHQPGDPRFSFSAINMVANYYKSGPGTGRGGNLPYRIVQASSGGGADDYGSWYVTDNYVEGYPDVTADNWGKGGISASRFVRADTAAPFIPIVQQTAEKAYLLVLEHVGAVLPRRDIVDERVIQEVTNGMATYGTGQYNQDSGFGTTPTGIIDSQTDVGGWPELKSTPAPTDTDHDGMPDDWETAKGLNKDDPEDKNGLGEGGYTNLENYLNSAIEYPTSIPVPAKEMVPNEFGLGQNYPNPFNPSTQIEFSCPIKSTVKLEVFDITGKNVATLIDEVKEAGTYSVDFNGLNLGTGLYLYKLTTENKTRTRKMFLIK